MRRLVVVFLLASIWLVTAIPARSQGRLISAQELSQYEKLRPDYRSDLIKGQLGVPFGDKHKKDVALMAKYYVYFMTIPERQQDGAVEQRRKEFDLYSLYYILKEEIKPNNKEFRKRYSQELAKCFRTVFVKDSLGNPKQDITTCIHVGLLLPMAARLDDPSMLDMLIELIREDAKPLPAFGSTAVALGGTPFGQNALLTSSLLAPSRSYGKYDIVKLFAFKALQVYLGHSPLKLNPYASDEERLALAAKIGPIANYTLNPPMHFRSQSEVDGFRYIRQEAIKALGTVPFYMLPEAPNPIKKTVGKILVPVAYTHMRILAGVSDGLYPRPLLSEKCEAAIGLCNIKGFGEVEESFQSFPNRYNEDLAVVLLGEFALEFFQELKKDQGIIAVNNQLPPKLPWRMYSDFLKGAFDRAPKQFTPGSKAKSNMNELTAAASPMFEEILTKGMTKANINISQLFNTVKAIPRPNPDVYAKTSYQIKLQ